MKWKFEEEFRKDKPETIGETDSHFDLDNYKDWLEERLSWKDAFCHTPPENIEILAKAPNGIIHLTNWRPAYDIFCCQVKSESVDGWEWKMI